MGLDQTLAVTCLCGASNQVVVQRSWIVDEPAELARLSSLRFNLMTCVACERTIPLEVELLVIHRAHGWAIQVTPDDAKVDNARNAMATMFTDGTRARVVANRNELVEKARLFEAGIDDAAFAICKFQRALMLGEGGKRTFVLWFERVTGDQLVLAAFEHGRHVGQATIPRDYHAKIVGLFVTAQYARYMILGDDFAQRALVAHAARGVAAPASAPPPTAPRAPEEFQAQVPQLAAIAGMVQPPPTGTQASAPPSSFAQAFATRFWVGGVKAIRTIARHDVAASASAPAHSVQVIQRILTDDVVEGWRYLITDGLSARPLTASRPGALRRFELMTMTDQHDRTLLDTFASIGEMIHQITASPDAAPIELGHTIRIGGTGIRGGWTTFLLARITSPVEGPWGETEIAQLVPITLDERDELRGRQDMFQGSGFVTMLENQDFQALIDRWYALLPARANY